MKEVRILIVEDNPDDVELVKEILENAHYSPFLFFEANSLSAGLMLLETETFDIILMDMSLSDSSGANTFFRLHSYSPDTPIIALTGNRDDAMIGNLLQNGAQDYLIKGMIDPDFLAHSIDHAIERQRMLVSLKRKTNEIQALRESLEHIVSNNADAIIVIDQQGIILFANPAAAQIFNRQQDEMVGRDFGFPIATGKTTELDIVRKDKGPTVAELRAVEITWSHKPAYLASIRDITERKQLQDEMKRLSFHDSLTGLYNRAFFEEEFKRLDVERNYPICIIIGDINNLKLVNDALGHSEGDRLLIAVAKIMRKVCRQEDVIVRYGGDEFVILLPRCDERIAARIIGQIKLSSREILSGSIPTSIAMGMAFKKDSGQSLTEIINAADDRMYANKLAGSINRSGTILSKLEKTLYAKDYVTAEHALRVRDLCMRFGDAIHLNGDTIDELILLASLHDIGKIVVPKQILKKPGPLTEEEWKIIKKHPETGYRITRATQGMNKVSEDVLFHHERWDGKGYPQGLRKEDIPLASRILSVVDTYDVITHDRPYRKAASREDALQEIARCSGTQFDPMLTKAFLDCMNKT